MSPLSLSSLLAFFIYALKRKQNQTLGVRSVIPIPVTFFAHVYLDYDSDCRIQTIRAVAPSVPSQVLGVFFNFPSLGLLGLTSLLLLLGFVPRVLGVVLP